MRRPMISVLSRPPSLSSSLSFAFAVDLHLNGQLRGEKKRETNKMRMRPRQLRNFEKTVACL